MLTKLSSPLNAHEKVRSMFQLTLVIRAAIVWQDCFLSVCHGRPTSVSDIQVQNLYRSNTPNSRLTYTEVMHSIAYICFEVTESNSDTERSVRLLQSIDDCSSHAQLYLQTRDSCSNMQEILEYLALQINTSFTICFLCRPAMNKSTPILHTAAHSLLVVRAKKGLLYVLERFLEFQALSIIPMRSWSIIHSALTSIILLSIWEETRDDLKSRELQESVLNVLLRTNQRDANVNADQEFHWLSTRKIRALMDLLETIRNTPFPATASDHASHISREQPELHGAQISGNTILTNVCSTSDQTYAAFDQT
jgi:hypothetical protein